jgi:hypothetical protein
MCERGIVGDREAHSEREPRLLPVGEHDHLVWDDHRSRCRRTGRRTGKVPRGNRLVGRCGDEIGSAAAGAAMRGGGRSF